jgi:phage repressor protein C with HTH and peptisase S24 domain
MDDVRQKIINALEAKGMTMADASRAIDLNHAYLQQFIKRNVHRELPPKVARKLAKILNLSMSELGVDNTDMRNDSAMVLIPEHDIRVSAGHGTIIDTETEVDRWPMPRRYIREYLSLRSSNLALIEVIGDSMEPTLRSGDKIMVDLNDKNIANPGIFALYDGDATVVKRIEKIPGSDLIRIKSDNSFHSSYDVDIVLINVAGRVVWVARRL